MKRPSFGMPGPQTFVHRSAFLTPEAGDDIGNGVSPKSVPMPFPSRRSFPVRLPNCVLVLELLFV